MQKLKDLYQTDQGVHCQFSSLANVVNYYNPNIKSSNLFFNGGYFKTHYRFEEGQCLSDIRLTNEFGKIYKKFFLKNQIKNQIIEYQENENEFRNYIKNEVDNFRPVLVAVMTNYLNYSSSYQTGYTNKHFIVILDVTKNGYIISDCFVPTHPSSLFVGEIEKEVFWNAFSAFKKTIISLESEKISKLQATNNKKFHIESNNFEDEELSIFANDLRRLPELFSEKEIYEQIPSLCFKIQFDSIIPARKMLLKAFDEYPSGVGTVYKEKVQEFIYRWQNIVYILIKISRRLSQQSLNTLNESVLSLLEDEKRFFKSVMEEN